MTARSRAVVSALAVLAVLPALAGVKVEHTNVVSPKVALEAPADLRAIGQPGRVMERGGTLYVAGTTGIAAISADGKLLWSMALDPTGVRELAIDDGGIAYTGYEIIAAKTSGWAFLGEMPKKLLFAPSAIGMLSPDGKKLWEVKGPPSRVSPPCLTPASIGVLTGGSFHIYDRADGKLTVSKMDLEMALIPNEYASRLYRPRPLFLDGNFVGGYFYNLYRIGPHGEEIEKESKNKSDIQAGPLNYHGNLLFGSYTTDMKANINKALVAVAKPSGEFEKVWREDVADDHSPTADLLVDGDTIYAATNFSVAAVGADGKLIWSAEGKDGGLRCGSMRGARFAGTIPYRYWGGQLLSVVGDKLCVSARREVSKKTWVDVITVLNKADGSYVKTIDMKVDLIDMAMFGPRLAVATTEGLKVLALD